MIIPNNSYSKMNIFNRRMSVCKSHPCSNPKVSKVASKVKNAKLAFFYFSIA